MKQINCKYFWKIITLSNYNFKKILCLYLLVISEKYRTYIKILFNTF